MADSRDEWADRAKRLLKAELKRSGVGYNEITKRLAEMGLPETVGSVTVKINRGVFPAWFFLAAMKALGRQTIKIDDL